MSLLQAMQIYIIGAVTHEITRMGFSNVSQWISHVVQ